jgi:hypothetical protein
MRDAPGNTDLRRAYVATIAQNFNAGVDGVLSELQAEGLHPLISGMAKFGSTIALSAVLAMARAEQPADLPRGMRLI